MKKEAKPFEPKRVIETVQYGFNHQELKQLGVDLAHATREAIRIENDKAVATARFNGLKKEAEALCSSLSLKIENGYEMRDMECIVVYSMPRPGYKQISRADTGEWIRDDPMTPEEMQAAFDFPAGGDQNKPQ